MRSNLWSPHPPSAYTVEVNGLPEGLGAREEFIDHLGLWNMFWLHSTKVDLLLDWRHPPGDAPADTLSMIKCIESVGYSCHGVSFEILCEFLTARELIDRVLMKGYSPPIRKFWEPVTGGWLALVNDRLKKFKSLSKPKGVLIQGNFPLHNFH